MAAPAETVPPTVKPLPPPPSGKTVAIVTTAHTALAGPWASGGSDERTGVWLGSLAAAWCQLRDAGHHVRLLALAHGAVPVDIRSFSKRGSNTLEVERLLGDPAARRAMARPALLGADATDGCDAVVLPGGHGCLWDHPDDPRLARALQHTLERGGLVAAVCHGVSALLARGGDGRPLAQGRRVTAFSSAEESAVGLSAVVPLDLEQRLRDAGAVFSCQPPFTPHVVLDGRLITGQNPASATGVMHALLARLAIDAPVGQLRSAPPRRSTASLSAQQ
jgi:putative intracellular protease/amidase